MVKKTVNIENGCGLEEGETLYTIQTKDEDTTKILLQAKKLYYGVDELLNTLARWRNKGWADPRLVSLLKSSLAEARRHDDEGVESSGTIMDEDCDVVLFNIDGALLADALYTYVKEVSEFKDIGD